MKTVDYADLFTEKLLDNKELPLALRMRPVTLDEFVGQEHILGKGKLLRRAIEADRLTSLILYGPPGTGKTSLAWCISHITKSHFVSINATTSNVEELRRIIQAAKNRKASTGKKTILFIDEIHRFNKAQQDVLLPDVEEGNPILIGATVHNPFFSLASPLLSRSLVCELKALKESEISRLITRALNDKARGFGNLKIKMDKQALAFLSRTSEGDARRALNALEVGAPTPPTIEILNPLSKEQEILRPRIIPGLVGCVANNLNQKQAYVNIFEIAKVFSVAAESLKEELVLAIALCGVKSLLLEQGLIKEEVGLLHLKGIFEVLFERLGIKDYKFNSKDNPSQILIYVNKEKIGIMKIFSRNRLEKLDIKNKDVLVVEVSLDKLFSYANLSKKFAALPIYPAMSRDISFILREGIAIDEVLKSMREKGSPLLREVKIVDYYKGKQIPSGYRSLTVSCLYRLDERTLTEAEINPVHSLVTFVLADKFSAQIRKT